MGSVITYINNNSFCKGYVGFMCFLFVLASNPCAIAGDRTEFLSDLPIRDPAERNTIEYLIQGVAGSADKVESRIATVEEYYEQPEIGYKRTTYRRYWISGEAIRFNEASTLDSLLTQPMHVLLFTGGQTIDYTEADNGFRRGTLHPGDKWRLATYVSLITGHRTNERRFPDTPDEMPDVKANQIERQVYLGRKDETGAQEIIFSGAKGFSLHIWINPAFDFAVTGNEIHLGTHLLQSARAEYAKRDNGVYGISKVRHVKYRAIPKDGTKASGPDNVGRTVPDVIQEFRVVEEVLNPPEHAFLDAENKSIFDYQFPAGTEVTDYNLDPPTRYNPTEISVDNEITNITAEILKVQLKPVPNAPEVETLKAKAAKQSLLENAKTASVRTSENPSKRRVFMYALIVICIISLTIVFYFLVRRIRCCSKQSRR